MARQIVMGAVIDEQFPLAVQVFNPGGSGLVVATEEKQEDQLAVLNDILAATGSVAIDPQAPVAYRTGLTAADVLAAPGALTTSVVTGGALANSTTYKSKVVAGNQYGRTTATAGTDRATSSPNLTLRIAIPQVVGASYYDIYVSTDTDPKWVGRISEAQRASGIKLTAVGVTGAGSIAGAVDAEVAGTGLQAGTTAAQNTAYAIPASPIDTSGFQFVDFDLILSGTGDAVYPSLTVVPFFQNPTDAAWYQGEAITLNYGGMIGAFNALAQKIRVECRGAAAVALLVLSISGTGASLNVLAGCS